MTGRLLVLAAGAALTPLGGGLIRGLVQTQRLGPGAAHPEIGRATLGQSRRSFLRWTILAALAVGGAQAGLALTRYAWPNKTGLFGTEILAARVGELPAVDAPPLQNREGRFYLIHNPEGLLAFSWTCTHLGCVVPWNAAERQFHCPCHQSQFNRYGEVVDGPAPRPLDLLPIRLEGDAIYVDTGAPIRRGSYEPEQITPV